MTEAVDHYEFFQISRNADQDTIHRVHKFLAARFHPDNPETGDSEKFLRLQAAWNVLSDPQRRADYDAACAAALPPPEPLSDSVDFMDDIEGEMNRRLAVLALLYMQRRINPYKPELSVMAVEKCMGFPRDYLQFTTWYLQNKKFVTRADNSDLTLTVAGVDYVESNRASIPILNKLLTTGAAPSAVDRVAASAEPASQRRRSDRRLSSAEPED